LTNGADDGCDDRTAINPLPLRQAQCPGPLRCRRATGGRRL